MYFDVSVPSASGQPTASARDLDVQSTLLLQQVAEQQLVDAGARFNTRARGGYEARRGLGGNAGRHSATNRASPPRTRPITDIIRQQYASKQQQYPGEEQSENRRSDQQRAPAAAMRLGSDFQKLIGMADWEASGAKQPPSTLSAEQQQQLAATCQARVDHLQHEAAQLKLTVGQLEKSQVVDQVMIGQLEAEVLDLRRDQQSWTSCVRADQSYMKQLENELHKSISETEPELVTKLMTQVSRLQRDLEAATSQVAAEKTGDTFSDQQRQLGDVSQSAQPEYDQPITQNQVSQREAIAAEAFTQLELELSAEKEISAQLRQQLSERCATVSSDGANISECAVDALATQVVELEQQLSALRSLQPQNLRLQQDLEAAEQRLQQLEKQATAHRSDEKLAAVNGTRFGQMEQLLNELQPQFISQQRELDLLRPQVASLSDTLAAVQKERVLEQQQATEELEQRLKQLDALKQTVDESVSTADCEQCAKMASQLVQSAAAAQLLQDKISKQAEALEAALGFIEVQREDLAKLSDRKVQDLEVQKEMVQSGLWKVPIEVNSGP